MKLKLIYTDKGILDAVTGDIVFDPSGQVFELMHRQQITQYIEACRERTSQVLKGKVYEIDNDDLVNIGRSDILANHQGLIVNAGVNLEQYANLEEEYKTRI